MCRSSQRPAAKADGFGCHGGGTRPNEEADDSGCKYDNTQCALVMPRFASPENNRLSMADLLHASDRDRRPIDHR
jgi:hypothetical protein